MMVMMLWPTGPTVQAAFREELGVQAVPRQWRGQRDAGSCCQTSLHALCTLFPRKDVLEGVKILKPHRAEH